MKDVGQKGGGKVQEEDVLLACEFILEVELVSRAIVAFELGEYEFYDAVLNEDWDELSLD
jgi:hypothetical protein